MASMPEAVQGGDTLGVVLAGGLSRRMEHLGPKPALPIGGESLLARVVRRLLDAGLPAVLVVGPPEVSALVPGVPVVADRRPGTHGPLAGLETALAWASSDAARAGLGQNAEAAASPSPAKADAGQGPVMAAYRRAFVVACDMPFVAPALVRAMVERAADLPAADEACALVLRSATGTEQLHAVYTLTCLPVASSLLDAGARSLRELLARVRTVEYPAPEAARDDPSGLSAFNANTPNDWQRALDIAAAEEE